MMDSYLKSLLCPLPEDIAHLKGAGQLSMAKELINQRLKGNLPDMLRERLETEKRFLDDIPASYPLTREQLVTEMRGRVADFDDKELDELLRRGLLDLICVDGVLHFHEDTVASLLKTQPELNARANPPYDSDRSKLDAVILRMQQSPRCFRYRLRATMRIRAWQPGTLYRIHLPLAARSMQQGAAQDIAASETILSMDAEDAPQRTAYIESSAESVWLEFTVEQRPRYVDAMNKEAYGIVYPQARPKLEEDLAEQPPHIAFTPYLRSLAAELSENEKDPVCLARKFYDYVTENVMYAYQRPYRLIEGGAEYTAVNLRGDCGLQALLFIALCRISGIPARWQSGLYAAPGDVGSHDWAEFYSERFGWLPVDCSFGGAACRLGSKLRHDFYFGNLDPWRMVANRQYYGPFIPDKNFRRADPYDNQRGEVETDRCGLTGAQFSTRWEMLWSEEQED